MIFISAQNFKYGLPRPTYMSASCPPAKAHSRPFALLLDSRCHAISIVILYGGYAMMPYFRIFALADYESAEYNALEILLRYSRSGYSLFYRHIAAISQISTN